jgi:AcrR family transcriptional regulator
MARPDRSDARRAEFVRTIATTFAELGYRRTTTAVLAKRCGLQEAALYRLWPDKQAMFVAAIEFVGENSERIWAGLAANGKSTKTGAERVLEYEAKHLGEFGLYRILFAGFSETDDEAINQAMRRVYERFLHFIAEQVEAHRRARKVGAMPAPLLTAWALVGLGTATNLGRELGLLSDRARKQLFSAIGEQLLG